MHYVVRIHILFHCCESALGTGSIILGQWCSGYRSSSGSGRSRDWMNKSCQISQSKIAIYLSLGLNGGRPSYRRSLPLSRENIQQCSTLNFLNFFFFGGYFLYCWVRIQKAKKYRVLILNTDAEVGERWDKQDLAISRNQGMTTRFGEVEEGGKVWKVKEEEWVKCAWSPPVLRCVVLNK